MEPEIKRELLRIYVLVIGLALLGSIITRIGLDRLAGYLGF